MLRPSLHLSTTIDAQIGPVAAAQIAAREIAAGASERDLKRIIPHEQMSTVRTHRLQATRVPREFGGGGESFADLVEVTLRLASADPNVAQSLQSHFFLLELMRIGLG